jgi:hypothetical protein
MEDYMNKKTALFSEIVFYGAIWGLLEATLGYLLHWLPALIAGSVMFPIGAFIIVRVSLKNKSQWAGIFVALIAAGIKAFDFFLPLPPQGPIKIINPMLCIVLEACLVVAVLPVLNKNRTITNLLMLPAASTAWRVLFIAIMFLINGTAPKQIQTWDAALSFFVYNNLVSGVIATGLYYINLLLVGKWDWKWSKKPIFASLTLVLSIAVSLLVSYYL